MRFRDEGDDTMHDVANLCETRLLLDALLDLEQDTCFPIIELGDLGPNGILNQSNEK